MSGHIFLLQDGGGLVRMSESRYDSEALLQELLAKYPDLLAGDQIDGAEPRRWLLVSREMGVPDEEDGGDRWSLDHLFLDQDAIPTLVEVKRSSDTRIRREVVGQMLDYAANAVVYWPVETIRARFEKTCEAQGTDPATALVTFLGDTGEAEAFWQRAKTNLQAGRVRLVFVADEVPPELRRVVEFLNGQMDPAEVLAVEIKQFTGAGKLTTLVPRLVGQTAAAQQQKKAEPRQRGRRSTRRPTWTRCFRSAGPTSAAWFATWSSGRRDRSSNRPSGGHSRVPRSSRSCGPPAGSATRSRSAPRMAS